VLLLITPETVHLISDHKKAWRFETNDQGCFVRVDVSPIPN
jgi:hypothetical protein